MASKLWGRTKFLCIRKETLGEGRTGRGIQGGKLENQMLGPGGEGAGEPAAGQLEQCLLQIPMPTELCGSWQKAHLPSSYFPEMMPCSTLLLSQQKSSLGSLKKELKANQAGVPNAYAFR